MLNISSSFVGTEKIHTYKKDMFLLFILHWKKNKLFIQKITHIPENTDWSQ